LGEYDMAVDGFGMFIILGVYLLLIAVVGFMLYVVVRFAVKHGVRSYHAEAARRPGSGNEA
jgi:Na+-transporting methylmalonyl-CoA/oxaloacetate decarboxylase gamma subunit